MSPDRPIGESIQRSLRILTVATVVLFLIVGGIALWVWSSARENHDALCALRGDLERRVTTSKKFLEDNPAGIPGVDPAVIQAGIDNQRATVRALSGLSC